MNATEFRQRFRLFVQEEAEAANATDQVRLLEAGRLMEELTDDQVETFAGILQEAFREQTRQDLRDEVALRGDPC